MGLVYRSVTVCMTSDGIGFWKKDCYDAEVGVGRAFVAAQKYLLRSWL